jgi:hypothetical protein
MTSLEDLVRPELLVMIPALNFIATLMKKRGADSTRIPARLGIGGIFLALCYELATIPITDLQSACNILFTGVTQGLLCAAGAVYLHQLKHQREKGGMEQNGDTSAPTPPPAPSKEEPPDFVDYIFRWLNWK